MTGGRLALALAVVIAGCGVPDQRHASRIADDQVPFGLLAGSEVAGVETTTSTIATAAPMAIFLVDGERLLATPRSLADDDATTLLDALLAGPTEQEEQRGIRSALVDPNVVKSVELDGRTAVIDLAASFTDTPPAEQRLALAQLTFTATEDPAVSATSFSLEGEPITVPRADGTSTEAPVSRADYATLVGPPAPAP
jgi:hypothetical protein